jgi:hypothetical protein
MFVVCVVFAAAAAAVVSAGIYVKLLVRHAAAS